MVIEFSKNGEGKVFIGISCRKVNDGYQKMLVFDDIGNNDCKIGDQIHKDYSGERLGTLIFNKDESIDILIKKLQELKRVSPKEKLEEKHKELCNNPNCSCQLTYGC